LSSIYDAANEASGIYIDGKSLDLEGELDDKVANGECKIKDSKASECNSVPHKVERFCEVKHVIEPFNPTTQVGIMLYRKDSRAVSVQPFKKKGEKIGKE